jgi:hypothetical protein
MTTPLTLYASDHRSLLEAAGRRLGFHDPVAVAADDFLTPLLKASIRGAMLALDDVLVRSWDPDNRRTQPGVHFGMRVYRIDGIHFARLLFPYADWCSPWGRDFLLVDRKDYHRLYRIAVRCRRREEPPCQPPVLPAEQLAVLWQNTIGYLESSNLDRIRRYGGRARRGLLLTGPPGNGKTMACRWIWEACRQRHWEYRLVTPDNYRVARRDDSVGALFGVERRGIIFFDDMDLALRDRETTSETDDQAVFLSALDGIEIHEGAVFVFTTNCSLDLIDRAFKRPGRLDVVLHFKAPDASLRRQLIERWHLDIRDHIDMEMAVASTDGLSFAEIEELKNLLVSHYMDADTWDWGWAVRQFDINRSELSNRVAHIGFGNGRNSRLDRHFTAADAESAE